MKTKSILYAGLLLGALTVNTACEDMLSVDSSLVQLEEDHNLNSPTDTVYSVIGIIGEMQKIADRTLLLGELRGDLVQVTDRASNALRQLADFTAGTDNAYNSPKDYYSVINNCNYFLAYADTTLDKRGQKVFEKEYAAVKTYRAWTYLQLAQVYGSVPFITDPILTELQADLSLYPVYNLDQICSYFIEDLVPYIETKFPQYGNISGMDSKKFFFPTRLVLGDLCLWGGRYYDAAQYYHDYLDSQTNPMPLGTSRVAWYNQDFTTMLVGYSNIYSADRDEIISYIPMETTAFNGVISDLDNIFNSVSDNDYYFQVTPASGLISLSIAQSHCYVYANPTTGLRDTLYAPKENARHDLLVGDLRLYDIYNYGKVSVSSTDEISADRQYIYKIGSYGVGDRVVTYRLGHVYLRYAEALNRAGFPESAFAVLKYGLNSTNVEKYINEKERESSGSLLSFNVYNFTESNTMGIHGRGCGDADADANYVMPMPSEPLASYEDTVAYQQPLVEDLILEEMALETSFEGLRYYDLMRVALRRGDESYLARRVAMRNKESIGLMGTLMDKNNWYLPLK